MTEVDNKKLGSVTECIYLSGKVNMEQGERGKSDRGRRHGVGTGSSFDDSSGVRNTKKGLYTYEFETLASSNKNEKQRTSLTLERVESKDKERKKSFLSVFKFGRRKPIRDTSCSSESDTVCDSLIPFVHELEEPKSGIVDTQVDSDAKQVLKLKSQPRAATMEGTRTKTKTEDHEKKVGRWQQMRNRFQQKMLLPNKMDAVVKQESSTEKKKSGEISPQMEKSNVDSIWSLNNCPQLSFSSATESFSDQHVEKMTKTEERESAFPCPAKTSRGDSLPKILQAQKSLPPNWNYSNSLHPSEETAAHYLNLTSAEQMKGECISDSASNCLNSGPAVITCQGSLKVSRASSFLSKKESMRQMEVMEAGDVFLQQPATLKPQLSKEKLELRRSAGAVTDMKANRDRNIFQAFLRRHRFSISSISKSVTSEVEVTDTSRHSPVSAINLESFASRNSFQLLGSAENCKVRTSPNANLKVSPLPTSSLAKPILDLHMPLSFDDSVLLHKRAASLPDLINSTEKKMEKSFSIWKVAGNILPGTTETTESKQECNINIQSSKKKIQKRTRLSSLSEYRAVGNSLGSHQCVPVNHSISHCDDEQLPCNAVERVVLPPDENAGVWRRKRQRTTSVDRNNLASVSIELCF